MTTRIDMTDQELQRATDRAYREAARCWQDARRPGLDSDTRRILLNAASSAQDYWAKLRAEQARRMP